MESLKPSKIERTDLVRGAVGGRAGKRPKKRLAVEYPEELSNEVEAFRVTSQDGETVIGFRAPGRAMVVAGAVRSVKDARRIAQRIAKSSIYLAVARAVQLDGLYADPIPQEAAGSKCGKPVAHGD